MRVVFAFLALLASSHAFAEASLSGRFGNYTSYFTEAERVRHNRYELHLLQTATITPTLSSTIEGRFRFDGALYPGIGTYKELSRSVRDDEMAEAAARQIYVDYLSDVFGLKLGLQQIDWVESLSPRTSDIMTPLDLRHGGNGTAKDIIEPVFALSLNHAAPFGSFEWLFIPEGKHHRLPHGPNGYGYYESLIADDQVEDITVTTEERKKHISESEGGLRYLMRFDSIEATLLGFHGHQRYPALRVDPLDASGIRRNITETYPQANVFGASLAYGGEALVARLNVYHEPKRQPGVFVERSPVVTITPAETITSFVDNRSLYERRTKYGVGLDYVFSKDLKIYSEHFMTQSEFFYDGDDDAFEAPLKDKRQQRFVNSVRLTNESIDNLFLSLDATVVGPEKGRSFNPKSPIP